MNTMSELGQVFENERYGRAATEYRNWHDEVGGTIIDIPALGGEIGVGEDCDYGTFLDVFQDLFVEYTKQYGDRAFYQLADELQFANQRDLLDWLIDNPEEDDYKEMLEDIYNYEDAEDYR